MIYGLYQVPHGRGTIYYFTSDKFNRVNYTGDWVDGEREGNGSTSFKDGAVYEGEYKEGLENGVGIIRYPNGNRLDAEFVAGKIQGHGVFRYIKVKYNLSFDNYISSEDMPMETREKDSLKTTFWMDKLYSQGMMA